MGDNKDKRIAELEAEVAELRQHLELYGRGRSARAGQVEERCQALHAMITARKMSVDTARDFRDVVSVFRMLHSDLAHRRTGDIDSAYVSMKAIRLSYFRWLRRQPENRPGGSAKTPCPRQYSRLAS
jgi:hypothetical protein